MKTQLIIFIAFAIAIGFASATYFLKPEPVRLQSLTWFGEQAKPLAAFALTDHNNQPFTDQSIKGKWQLLFFGYTHCPDICPDTLQMLTNMVSQINDDKVLKQLQITFVSIDPERDDLQKLKTYVTYFNKQFMSATADIEQVSKLTGSLGILHHIDKSADNGAYQVSHSAALALIDPAGRYSGVISPPHDSSKIAHDLTALINL